MTAVGLRLMTLLLILVGAYSATPKTAAAQVTTVPLGCKASETGGNIVIPVSNDAPEGATVVVAVQVIARNEDLKAIVDPAGNSYTRLVKHLGFEVGPDGLKENYTLHVYIAPDAKTVKKGQTITVQWEFANQLEACAAAINGVEEGLALRTFVERLEALQAAVHDVRRMARQSALGRLSASARPATLRGAAVSDLKPGGGVIPGTKARLASTAEVNTTPTSFGPRGPAVRGA
jgi:hypothetical protein